MLVNSDVKKTYFINRYKSSMNTQPYKNSKNTVRVNSKGEFCLKNKKLPKKDHFESIKIHSYKEDLYLFKGKGFMGLECKEVPYFFKGWDALKQFILGLLLPLKKDPTLQENEEKEWCELLKKQIHKRMAQDIFYLGETRLGKFSFQEVYLSKNHRYYEEGLGLWAHLETWGVSEGKTTLIDIRGVKNHDFQKIKGILSKNHKISSYKKHPLLLPIFYEIQSQLLCTGMKKSLVHLVNLQERKENLTFMIQGEEDILNEISFWVEKFNHKIILLKKKVEIEKHNIYIFLENFFKREWFMIPFPHKKEEREPLSSNA